MELSRSISMMVFSPFWSYTQKGMETRLYYLLHVNLVQYLRLLHDCLLLFTKREGLLCRCRCMCVHAMCIRPPSFIVGLGIHIM